MKTIMKWLSNGNFVWVFFLLIAAILAGLWTVANFMNFRIYGAYMFEYPGLFFVYFIALIVVMILVFVLILYESIKAKHIVLPCNDSPDEFKLLVLLNTNNDSEMYLLINKPFWITKDYNVKDEYMITIPEKYINAGENNEPITIRGEFKINSSNTNLIIPINVNISLKSGFSPEDIYEVIISGKSDTKDVGKFIETNYKQMISKNSEKAERLFYEFENNTISSVRFLNEVLGLIEPKKLFSNFRKVEVTLEMMTKTRKIYENF